MMKNAKPPKGLTKREIITLGITTVLPFAVMIGFSFVQIATGRRFLILKISLAGFFFLVFFAYLIYIIRQSATIQSNQQTEENK
jgi:hypothetical protein